MNKILPTILIVFLCVIYYETYKQATKSVKSKRLDCQETTTTFERIFTDEPIKEAIETFKLDNYEINSSIEYSKYMKSNLINILTKEQSEDKLKNIIKKYIHNINLNKNDKKVSINYYIYENDKQDMDKKNKEAKNYAGYLMFEFKYNNKLIYKIQTDYMDTNISDLDERMDCVINSFISMD